MHGGNNKGAPRGNRNAWKHGDHSAEAKQQLKTIKATDRDLRLLTKLNQGITLDSREFGRLADLLVEHGRFLPPGTMDD
jgi:hypothetical protein